MTGRRVPEWIGSTPDAKVPARVRQRVYDRAPNFRAKIEAKSIPEPNSGCWIWLGANSPKGYGHLYVGDGFQGAHRVSFIAHGGRLQDGQVVRHRCDSPFCVNPDHLVAGSATDNIHDCISRGRAKRGVSAGEANGSAKLTRSDVTFIREQPRTRALVGEMTRRFGVSTYAVRRILNGKGWNR